MKSRYKSRKKARQKENIKRKTGFFAKLSIFIITLLIILGIWGKFIEPNMLTVHDYKITSSNLPKSFNGFRVVHISDIHYGTGYNEIRLEKLIKTTNDLNPDIVVFTGDLIDEKFNISDESKKKIITNLNNINTKYGKYAIIGNHDVNNKDFEKIILDSGFKLLKNSYDTVYNKDNEKIAIFGFDDTLLGTAKNDKLNDKTIKDTKYKIVLVHEPDYIDKFLNDFEISLVLAGHSHGGQAKLPKIRPFFLPEGSKTYYKSYYNVDNTDVYISNGVGSSIVDFRLFSKPSINLYRIYAK